MRTQEKRRSLRRYSYGKALTVAKTQEGDGHQSTSTHNTTRKEERRGGGGARRKGEEEGEDEEEERRRRWGMAMGEW